MLRPAGGVRSAAKNSVSSGSAGICHQCSIASKRPSNQSWLMLVPSCSEIAMSTPTSRNWRCSTCATLSRTAKPACVISVNASRRPPRSRMPSPSASRHPASSSSARARAGIERYFVHRLGVSPRHGLDRAVGHRRKAVENRSGDQIAIHGQRERAAHAHVGKRRHLPLVERHVLVGVSRRAVDDQAGHAGELAMLVPGHRRHEVHLAGFRAD